MTAKLIDSWPVKSLRDVTIQPGRYWVCDPGCVLGRDLWIDALFDLMFDDKMGCWDVQVELPTAADPGVFGTVLVFNTAAGDGRYAVRRPDDRVTDVPVKGLPVDSGSLGLVDVRIATPEQPWHAALLTLTEPLVVCLRGGNLRSDAFDLITDGSEGADCPALWE